MILDDELKPEGGSVMTEVGMVTINSETHVFNSFEKVSMVSTFIDQIAHVVKELEKNRLDNGPVGLVRPSIVLTVQPTKEGTYETMAYVDALFFHPEADDRLRGLPLINLADMAGRAKDRANDLVNSAFLEEYKFNGD
jgi:hypothetical protein